MLTPVEAAALEPLAPPPLRELWEALTGTLQPIDLGVPLSELVRSLQMPSRTLYAPEGHCVFLQEQISLVCGVLA